METFTLTKDTPTRPSLKRWQFGVNGDHAGAAMRTDYVDQLKRVHHDLGFERLRFHGIFSDDMHTWDTLGDVLGNDQVPPLYENNFRMVGTVYDNVLAAGMKPFVELSFMPQHLARSDKRGTFYYKPNISLPKSDDQWQEYIRTFVRYLIHRYGADEIETWFFEVWNEPDLTESFFDGTQEDYFHFYEITVKAVKEVDPAIRVGGPATSASRWVGDFVAFCKEHGVPFDFVSTHQYAGDPVTTVQAQGATHDQDSTSASDGDEKPEYDPQKLFAGLEPSNGILQFFRRILHDGTETDAKANRNIMIENAAVVHKQADGKPVFYTEWNTCGIFSPYTNDTRKVAAYDVRTILATDTLLEGSAIWCFSDILEELHPFPEEFHGGFGLMTQHGIRKPIYHALRFLAQTGDERYMLPGALDGDVNMAAFRKGSDIQVVLVRQNLHHEENANAAAVPTKVLVQLDRAPRSVVLQRIDEDHCNPLRQWESMGSPKDMTPKLVQQIDAESEPVEETLPADFSDGYLEFTTSLGTNDVHFITIHTGKE
jgi:xylan 1,4-beta-xylosidase